MTKPILIFLHGGPGFRDYLSPYFQNLEGITTVFYDQLQGPKVTVDDLVNQLDKIIDLYEGKKIIVGHSWGGVLATEYALKNQHKLSGLVLMSTGLNFHHWKVEFEDEKKRLNLVNASPEDIFLAEDERDEGASFLEETWKTFSEETFDNLFDNYIKSFDLTKKLRLIHVPILNIFGEKDVRFPSRAAKDIRTFNDKIIDVEIPGAGHFPFLKVKNKKLIIEAIKQLLVKA